MRPIFALLVLIAALAPAGPAHAQAEQVREADPVLEDNRYMRYTRPKAWLVEGSYFIYPDGRRVRNINEFAGWRYDGLRIVMPYVTQSAQAWITTDDTPFPLGAIALDYRRTTAALEARRARVPGTHAPYMIYETSEPVVFERLQFDFISAMVCVETEFDQRAAWDLPWPEAWPADAAPWLARDPVFDVDDAEGVDRVAQLLEHWTEGGDPKALPPVQLAKFLTGSVLDHIRTNVNTAKNPVGRPPRLITTRVGPVTVEAPLEITRDIGRTTSLPGVTSGFSVQNAADAAVSGRGSFHDYSNLLTAVLRRAGIPARTVIGIDKNENGINKRYKSWVEFALVAPDLDRTLWVPVDIWELRSSGRSARNWQQPWKHFGTTELRDTVPVAFHFHPPAEYKSYDAPALYGIRAQDPLPDLGIQGLLFNVNSLPQRGGRRP
ncbi:MAG: transglutaminase-like domain-containing protein [Phycisphaerales bacterium]|nr:transglutaminase domain-containing protein [Planctomycetota bacterium]MCH8508282.1 transglutaminase-like domain-containing protein [Phycisphaerales bacterium]